MTWFLLRRGRADFADQILDVRVRPALARLVREAAVSLAVGAEPAAGVARDAVDGGRRIVDRVDRRAMRDQFLDDVARSALRGAHDQRAPAGAGRQASGIGGEEPTRVLATAERYDIAEGKWISLPPIPTARHGEVVATV